MATCKKCGATDLVWRDVNADDPTGQAKWRLASSADPTILHDPKACEEATMLAEFAARASEIIRATVNVGDLVVLRDDPMSAGYVEFVSDVRTDGRFARVKNDDRWTTVALWYPGDRSVKVRWEDSSNPDRLPWTTDREVDVVMTVAPPASDHLEEEPF